MAPQLAWIGLGNMGRGMCKNLAEKGKLDKPLILYNRTAARAHALSEKLGKDKATAVESISEVVQKSDIIFSCVANDASIDETIDALLQHDMKGKLIVDCSTVHPDTTERLAKRVTAAGAHFVAGPVFGAPAMADAGQLVFVLAGPKEDVQKVVPYTEGVMGRAVIDFSGEPCGKATTLKVIGNTFILQMTEALAQGHTVAETSGLGVDNLHKFVEVMFPGPYTAYSQRMVTGDYYREEPLFAVDLAIKDARHALDLASKGGAKMKAVEVAQAHLLELKKDRGEKGDLPGIYGINRKEAGLPFENGRKKQ